MYALIKMAKVELPEADEQSVGSKVRSMALMMEGFLAGPRSTLALSEWSQSNADKLGISNCTVRRSLHLVSQ
jgi:hypothetical protein